MKNANVVTLGFLTVVLFVLGLARTALPGIARWGLILSSVMLACTAILVNEIRQAKHEIAEKIERQTGVQ